MSTSCIYGFKKNEKLKLMFNISDSYPSGFGKDIVLFIRENTLEQLNEICDNITLKDRKDFPNDREINEMKEKNIYYEHNEKILNWDDIFWINDTFLNYYKNDFYVIPDYQEWLDGLHDYLYIINLDNNNLGTVFYSVYIQK
ncbi:MAG: hypothetical protein IKF38_03005 [Clostridia bacterium]|nr:hypothetical protein [Clostridia bacterium]